MKRTARASLFERLIRAAQRDPHDRPNNSPDGTRCWLWDGSKCNKGYGCIRVAGVTKRVHIAAWELVKGRKVRRGYTLDHGCRNKACWRPSHLVEMTRAKNTAKGNRDNPRDTSAARKAAWRKRNGEMAQAYDGVLSGTHVGPDPVFDDGHGGIS